MKINEQFSGLVEQMPGLLQSLESQRFRTVEDLADIPKQGVYAYYEGNKALYVGRSNRLRERLREHCGDGSTHTSATFAFNIAKEEWGPSADDVTRKKLEEDPGFNKVFSEARKRVREMKIRVVQIDDQITQALFEINAALALETTQYNKFDTH